MIPHRRSKLVAASTMSLALWSAVAPLAVVACKSEEASRSASTATPAVPTASTSGDASLERAAPPGASAAAAPTGETTAAPVLSVDGASTAAPKAAARAPGKERPRVEAGAGTSAAASSPSATASPVASVAPAPAPAKGEASPAPSALASAAAGEPPGPLPSAEAPGPAAPNSADAIAEKVDVIYAPIQRFRARFEQKYTAKVAGTTKNSSGSCSIQRPSKVSFSYQSPNKNRVVSDGKMLKIYEAENQQMFLKSVASTEYPGALAFILGKGLRHSFTFTFNESAKWEGGPVIVGTPRVPNPGYEKVFFYIDEELLKKGDPSCVRRVLVIDAQGNRNRFDFIDVSQPDSIPDSEFVFEPPPGTNVLQ